MLLNCFGVLESNNQYFRAFFTIYMFLLFRLANRLGSTGAKVIADVLKVNTMLKSLSIAGESFLLFFFRFFFYFLRKKL